MTEDTMVKQWKSFCTWRNNMIREIYTSDSYQELVSEITTVLTGDGDPYLRIERASTLFKRMTMLFDVVPEETIESMLDWMASEEEV